MALYFVRHGQTDWNLQRRFQSRSDVPLNATGMIQAQGIGNELKRRKLNFKAVYSSPMQRAVDTAKIITADSKLHIDLEPCYLELNLGEYEGRFEADLEREFGETYHAWRTSEFTIAPPGGETIFEAVTRVRKVLFGLKQSAMDNNVLIVAHQSILVAMKIAITGLTDRKTLAAYKQANDEVDIWDFATGLQMERFRISHDNGF